MAKKVFFSFHYQDVIDFRANVVRNHWVTQKRTTSGFFDASIWETAKKTSPLALKQLINKSLKNTTVTCVLIGSNTFSRRWVEYEIIKSVTIGNKIIGVHINGVKGKDGKTKKSGPNPFYYLGYKYSNDGSSISFVNYINGEWEEYSDIKGYKLEKASVTNKGKIIRLSSKYKVYDWIDEKGFDNFSDWVDK